MLAQNRYEARQVALRMLSFRAYSEYEIRQKLNARGFSSDIIADIIYYLKDKEYLNDAALCNSLVNTYCKSNKYSLRMIIAKLKQRGIREAIIREAVSNYDISLEYKTAVKIVSRRFTELSAEKDKVASYLARKGFSNNIIAKIIRNLE